MRKIATGRIVGLLIAVITICLSILGVRDARRLNAQFDQWVDARPMETAIDLSQPGETTVPFHQTCGSSHGEALYLECDTNRETQQNPEELLEHFSGNVVIKDADGNAIESLNLDNKSAQFQNGQIMLAGFRPFPRGDYLATIRVDSGASALTDTQHTIYAKYQLCGLEQFPATIVGFFAFGTGVIGFVAAVCVLPGLLRYGIWSDTHTKNI